MRVLLAGASGYIGQAVLQTLLARNYAVVALVRNDSAIADVNHPQLSRLNIDLSGEFRNGPGNGFNDVASDNQRDHPNDDLRQDSMGNLCDDPNSETANPPRWYDTLGPVDYVISCLASRGGGVQDAVDVEYGANHALLEAAKILKPKRFLLLSAICVQKPKLEFQRQKLRFERELIDSELDATIVRPTAFFKSLGGQAERVRQGKAFLVFGDGLQTACKPIAREDLAAFMLDRLEDPNAANNILPIGGPGPALTPMDQARLLANALGKPHKTRCVSPRIFDIVIGALKPLGVFSNWCRDKAEFARIGRYYATESMLVWDDAEQCYSAEATPETGSITLSDFYQKIADNPHEAPALGQHKMF